MDMSQPGLQRLQQAALRIEPKGPAAFSTLRFGALSHDVHLHPLMQLDRLAVLAEQLAPTRQCRFLQPGTTADSRFFHRPKSWDGRPLREVFDRIEEPGSWIALYNIETQPEYGALLRGIVEQLRPIVEPEQGEIFLVTGFVFISAPPSITPFHIDRENNFWLQLRGRKLLRVWDRLDRRVVPTPAVERFIVDGDLSEVRLTDERAALATHFDVGAGEGVFFPSTTPHTTSSERSWCVPGDGVAMSIGINFYSDLTRRHARVHQCNRLLRRAGVEPLRPGESPLRDALKAPIGRALGAMRARRSGVTAPPGSY